MVANDRRSEPWKNGASYIPRFQGLTFTEGAAKSFADVNTVTLLLDWDGEGE